MWGRKNCFFFFRRAKASVAADQAPATFQVAFHIQYKFFSSTGAASASLSVHVKSVTYHSHSRASLTCLAWPGSLTDTTRAAADSPSPRLQLQPPTAKPSILLVVQHHSSSTSQQPLHSKKAFGEVIENCGNAFGLGEVKKKNLQRGYYCTRSERHAKCRVPGPLYYPRLVCYTARPKPALPLPVPTMLRRTNYRFVGKRK